MGSGRVWYHLRVREMLRPGHWVKKSKFYEVKRPSDAVGKYTKRAKKRGVEHTIMWCEKDKRHDPDRLVEQTARLSREIRSEQEERIRRGPLGDIKEFLGLGGELLRELHRSEKEKVLKRRSHNQLKGEERV